MRVLKLSTFAVGYQPMAFAVALMGGLLVTADAHAGILSWREAGSLFAPADGSASIKPIDFNEFCPKVAEQAGTSSADQELERERLPTPIRKRAIFASILAFIPIKSAPKKNISRAIFNVWISCGYASRCLVNGWVWLWITYCSVTSCRLWWLQLAGSCQPQRHEGHKGARRGDFRRF